MKLGIAGTPLPDYESMTDEEIVEIARVGDIDAQEYLICSMPPSAIWTR